MIEITDEMVAAFNDRASRPTPLPDGRVSVSWVYGDSNAHIVALLEAVAPLIAAAEREECAKIAMQVKRDIGAGSGSAISTTCNLIADRIRARGNE